jgi:hypothetical protein
MKFDVWHRETKEVYIGSFEAKDKEEAETLANNQILEKGFDQEAEIETEYVVEENNDK